MKKKTDRHVVSLKYDQESQEKIAQRTTPCSPMREHGRTGREVGKGNVNLSDDKTKLILVKQGGRKNDEKTR